MNCQPQQQQEPISALTKEILQEKIATLNAHALDCLKTIRTHFLSFSKIFIYAPRFDYKQKIIYSPNFQNKRLLKHYVSGSLEVLKLQLVLLNKACENIRLRVGPEESEFHVIKTSTLFLSHIIFCYGIFFETICGHYDVLLNCMKNLPTATSNHYLWFHKNEALMLKLVFEYKTLASDFSDSLKDFCDAVIN